MQPLTGNCGSSCGPATLISMTHHVPMTSGKRCLFRRWVSKGYRYTMLVTLPTSTRSSIITGKMDGHILGQTNETFERYKFNTRAQHPDETTDTYVASLKNLQKTCNFCDCLQDSLLRDRIVFGVKDGNTRKRLLQEHNLDLRKCIDIRRTYENTASQLKVIAGNAVLCDSDVTTDQHQEM